MEKHFNFNKIILLLFLLLTDGISSNAQSTQIASPAGTIQMTIEHSDQLSYRITMDGKPIITNSIMGFQFANEPDMGRGFIIADKHQKEINETWRPVIKSKHEIVSDHYTSMELELIEKEGLRRRMDIQCRVYNNGVAFRYQLFPSENIGNRQLIKELTEYNLAADSKAWIADYKKYTSPQEEAFVPAMLGHMADSVLVGLPLLIEIDKQHYAAITEAKINNYPAFFIGIKNAGGISLHTKLSPLPSEKEDGVKARFAEKIFTPWRVIMLGTSPGDLIESEIIQNLNDPCAIKDISWIKPGISAWDHWWSGEVKMEMPVIKKYIDFASTQGWPYMLVDWQWYGAFDNPSADLTKTAAQLNMPELLSYAKAKKVKLWLWVTSKDANRNDNFKAAFALFEKWGIAGVKIDFMDRSDQEIVNWYHQIIRQAAEHHLMVDFHGAYKPDGIIRTWPNMITREGVMGNEYTKWSEKITPEHNVTIPFTRMLAGQMDYTPGAFINVTKSNFKAGQPAMVMNTRCQELAKFVIYESPLTVFCDHPDFVLGQPGADFLKIVPTVWDDSKVLSGYPGEHIVMAKRTGKKFIIGAMNNSEPRTIEIKLDFLPAGVYEMTYWEDAADADTNPRNLVKAVRTLKAKDIIKIKMAIGGGFVATLKEK